ncbi:hypothetical protein C2E20_3677 [Micractinium conductrix]|uniref:Non-reducing end beta-L-arabinofuranosidase-like GH127 catalytic domain-containing protein n=1 Tax=Micractinium conductrix TaxID=554055 RepID=A0A2P6VGE8_9CHLO|nr:hypothetical protein C2E20_3677 [Micractinium conductrix]|eukprot:PSC73151.1 hypothetical protein C2E20_3677 [Micractinium conductrix]
MASTLLLVTLAAAVVLLATPCAAGPRPPRINTFQLADVQLAAGEFLANHEQNNEYLLALDPDNMLFNFRKTAGLPAPGESYGGWEWSDSEVRGQFIGHYLSAVAFAAASTGRAEFYKRCEVMVEGLKEVQDKHGNGYLAAFPESFFDRLESLQTVWVPYYVVHKVMQGMLDQATLAGQEQALGMARGMGDYFCKRVNNVLEVNGTEYWWQVLNTEYGGMNEVLYNLYSLTQDESYAECAHWFDKPVFYRPLVEGQDPLPRLHANTHLAQVQGFAARYEHLGDDEALAATASFFALALQHHSFSTGGSNWYEHWGEEDSLGEAINNTDASYLTEESCTQYNMLKLARYMFRHTGDPALADYYERAILNGVIGIQKRPHDHDHSRHSLAHSHGHGRTHSLAHSHSGSPSHADSGIDAATEQAVQQPDGVGGGGSGKHGSSDPPPPMRTGDKDSHDRSHSTKVDRRTHIHIHTYHMHGNSSVAIHIHVHNDESNATRAEPAEPAESGTDHSSGRRLRRSMARRWDPAELPAMPAEPAGSGGAAQHASTPGASPALLAALAAGRASLARPANHQIASWPGDPWSAARAAVRAAAAGGGSNVEGGPGVFIYFLPLGAGMDKGTKEGSWSHGWGDEFNTFWCCYGTAIESFSKIADSIYFRAMPQPQPSAAAAAGPLSRGGGSASGSAAGGATDAAAGTRSPAGGAGLGEGPLPELWVNQLVSSTVRWRDMRLVLHQEADMYGPESAARSRITLDIYPPAAAAEGGGAWKAGGAWAAAGAPLGGEQARFILNWRIPSWANTSQVQLKINGENVTSCAEQAAAAEQEQEGVGAPPRFGSGARFCQLGATWTNGDVVEALMPMRVWAEDLTDARQPLQALKALMMGPLLMAGLTHDMREVTVNASLVYKYVHLPPDPATFVSLAVLPGTGGGGEGGEGAGAGEGGRSSPPPLLRHCAGDVRVGGGCRGSSAPLDATWRLVAPLAGCPPPPAEEGAAGAGAGAAVGCSPARTRQLLMFQQGGGSGGGGGGGGGGLHTERAHEPAAAAAASGAGPQLASFEAASAPGHFLTFDAPSASLVLRQAGAGGAFAAAQTFRLHPRHPSDGAASGGASHNQPSFSLEPLSLPGGGVELAGAGPGVAFRLAPPAAAAYPPGTRLLRGGTKDYLLVPLGQIMDELYTAYFNFVGEPPPSQYRTPLPGERFAYGGLSCVISAVITNPADVIKIRQQIFAELQAPATRGGSSAAAAVARVRPPGMAATLAGILRDEGLGGLMRGVTPSMLREASYSTIRYGAYEPIKNLMDCGSSSSGDRSGSSSGGSSPSSATASLPQQLPLWKKVAAGGCAGALGAAGATPSDLIKVRMQAHIAADEAAIVAHARRPPPAGIWSTAAHMYRFEGGLAALYRGVWPTTVRAAILTATQLPVYDHTKHLLLGHPATAGRIKEGPLLHFVCSMAAGLACSFSTAPVDLCKTRYMNQAFCGEGQPQRYKGMVDCAMQAVRSGGVLSLWAGESALLVAAPESNRVIAVFRSSPDTAVVCLRAWAGDTFRARPTFGLLYGLTDAPGVQELLSNKLPSEWRGLAARGGPTGVMWSWREHRKPAPPPMSEEEDYYGYAYDLIDPDEEEAAPTPDAAHFAPVVTLLETVLR